MNKDTVIFLLFAYAAMLLGVLLPDFGEPLRHLLPIMLLIQLLLCFLAVCAPNAPARKGSNAELAVFMSVKMILSPLAAWGLFALLMPKYALGAILMGGVSVGVTAPFFGQLSRADISFIIAAVTTSCLLLPLTMPLLVTGYLYAVQGNADAGLWEAFFMTGLSLALYIFLPFITAKRLWKSGPALAEGILRRKYWISVLSIACSMFIIFSRYSLPLRSNPFMVMEALAGAFLLAVVFLGIGIAAGRGKSPAEGAARLVSMGTVNNGLMLILSVQLFSLPETLICAMYSIPLFLLLIPYQRYADWKTKQAARRGAS